MKILLIGGCGYVGSALYPHLVLQGHSVDTVDLEKRGNRTNKRNLTWDYRMLSRLEIERYDAIVHLAGHSSVAACAADPHGAIKNNLIGVFDLLPRLTGKPFLYASSASVHSTNHATVYDGTKRALESLIPPLYPNACALRFGTVCGPAANLRTDLMIQAMVRSALTTGKVNVSNPLASRAILGTADLCRQVEQLLTGDYSPGHYNLCSFSALIGEIGEAVAETTNADYVEMPASPTYDFMMESDVPGARETAASIARDLVDAHKRGEWQ